MSQNGKIVYEMNIDIKGFSKSLTKTMGWRVRLAYFLVNIISKILRVDISIDYVIKQIK